MSDDKAVAVRQKSSVEHFNPDDSASLFMQTSLFEQVQRAALLLSKSNLVPQHLRGDDKVADCFLVIEQAMRWRMSPFAVAQSTYVLSGKLGYEGKLVAAVINASPRLDTKLNYQYSGQGDARMVKVSGTLRGETEPRVIEGTVKGWAQDRNPKWKDMPDQMLAYRGAREWARRHMPEVILGVYSDDEIEQIVRQPTVTTVSADLDDFMSGGVVAQDDAGGRPKEPAVEAEIVTATVSTLVSLPDSPKGIGEPSPATKAQMDSVKAKKPVPVDPPKSPKDQKVDDMFRGLV